MATTKNNGSQYRVTSDGYVKALPITITETARLFSVRAFNKGASDCYIQLHDAAASPSDMTAIVHVMPLLSGTIGGDEFPKGLIFTTGIQIFISSSATAATAIASSDANIVASFTYKKWM